MAVANIILDQRLEQQLGPLRKGIIAVFCHIAVHPSYPNQPTATSRSQGSDRHIRSMLQGIPPMPHPFKSIALIGNATDARVAECMLSLTRHLFARGLRALIDNRQPQIFPADTVVQCPDQSFAMRADLIISIGGDGTLLYAASLVAGHSVPLLGINRGRLGFLTDVGPMSMLDDVGSVL